MIEYSLHHITSQTNNVDEKYLLKKTQLCTGFNFMLCCNTIHTFVGTERNNSQPETDGSLSFCRFTIQQQVYHEWTLVYHEKYSVYF